MTVSVFGIRHHGPGSARSLRAALQEWQPDAVLVEGPPEGASVLPLAGRAEMRPPVALLVYSPAEPAKAAFWPFAAFSPEWQAVTWGLAHGAEVRFVDLATSAWLGDAGDAGDEPARRRPRSPDPLGWLAEAAGYGDPERWWDDMVEHHRDGPGPFQAVAEAMAAVREGEVPGTDPHEARREAAMRQGVRTAQRQGFERIAVVCGAWHAPALAEVRGGATADAALLRGLPRTKVAATWVPWTYGRLAWASGYGAGVTSPGWYHHLFTAPDRVVDRWLVKVAQLLRSEDLDASAGSVIDAVRLADTLAAVRGRPLAGLAEVTDAARAVLGNGYDAPMALVAERLVVGDALGEVPDDTPMVPLAQDLVRLQRRLRLKPEAFARELDLDLRRPIDLGRSHLLRRLALLGVGWGEEAEVEGKAGTFHEVWYLQWQPELAVALVEASMWGTTVEAAADAPARERAAAATRLVDLPTLAEECLLADLPGAVAATMDVLAQRAALDVDVGDLMDALPPLARVLRYGSVRRTDTEAVAAVVDGLVARICIGLPVAASSLDDEAAAELVRRISGVHGALAALHRADLRASWEQALGSLVDRAGLHGLVAGRATRLLLDGGVLPADGAAVRLAAVLSAGEERGRAAAWIEGFLSGSGMVLLHDEALLRLLDGWLGDVPGEAFTDLLPLLRRTFATFEASERRQIGERVRRLMPDRRGRAAAAGDDEDGAVDPQRAAPVLATVARLLGLQEESSG
ncbi:MAG TPA: DUF5682 family protein [Acidimicrobiales bacterium]|nr:DUF5682 family protein [Acidimicrobiales bacterium]